MRKIALVSVMVILFSGIAYAKGYEITKKAGEYTLVVTIDKNPPVVGDNSMTIDLKDTSSGRNVTDAKVKVEYSMAAMPGMPAMDYKTSASIAGSSYHAKMNLSMAGSWSVVVKIIRGGKTANVKFNIDAH